MKNLIHRKEEHHSRSNNDTEAALRPRPSVTQDWAAEIKRVWAEAGANTLELARVVHAARNQLQRGEWTKLWRCGRKLPFSRRKAQYLLVIWAGLGWATVHTCAHLPRGWRILYYVARLKRGELERLIAEGVIHPRLKLREAKKLLIQFSAKTSGTDSNRPRVLRRLERLAAFVAETLPGWTAQQRELAATKLREIVFQIEGATARSSGDRRTLAVANPSVTFLQPQSHSRL